ncbi:hypothetical protein [Veronia pacifica]|uniref:hypothetical protein n=1 Tax=Veronia pacifica TaxID=1080227 RepID=UPI001112EE64|nr:hypothetical protein [Veronia pacifica]
MQYRKPITCELVEFRCDECKKGVLRVISDKPIIHSGGIKQWPHRCSHCQAEGCMTYPFPLLRYMGEEFVLAKHVRAMTSYSGIEGIDKPLHDEQINALTSSVSEAT